MRLGWKLARADIPAEVREELERHGEAAVSAALAHPFDVPTSPMFSLRHEHKDHALAWLAEKRQIAERKSRLLRRVAIAGLIVAAVGLAFSAISAFYARRNFESNRPTVVFEFPRLNWSRGVGASVRLALQNIGTRPAVDVTAILGTANFESATPIRLAQLGPIGNPVYAHQPLAANVDVDPDKVRDVLVLCVSYRDSDDRNFDELQVYGFLGWPPREDATGPSDFAGGSVSREVYQRMIKADACARLH